MLKTKLALVSVDSSGNGVKLTLESAADCERTKLDSDYVLVSAGRVPFAAVIGSDKIGVETDKDSWCNGSQCHGQVTSPKPNPINNLDTLE
ncbi:hypothetical protein Vadar_028315 [Vaccinium darrowii]|uniref:Uncharacterized protein n=1 Tax=Vaccinium darrowii TaxID=229202 RepID=A0ACB7ZNK2_9ERIC|nr:hypothetical protein Vadar_028315 [Vaccinium darrowii]